MVVRIKVCQARFTGDGSHCKATLVIQDVTIDGRPHGLESHELRTHSSQMYKEVCVPSLSPEPQHPGAAGGDTVHITELLYKTCYQSTDSKRGSLAPPPIGGAQGPLTDIYGKRAVSGRYFLCRHL